MSLYQIDLFINFYIKWITLVLVVLVVNIEDWYIDHKKKIKLWLGRIYLKKNSGLKIFLNGIIRF